MFDEWETLSGKRRRPKMKKKETRAPLHVQLTCRSSSPCNQKRKTIIKECSKPFFKCSDIRFALKKNQQDETMAGPNIHEGLVFLFLYFHSDQPM